MSYDFPDEKTPIRQGDIFFPLPYYVLEDPMKIRMPVKEGYELVPWDDTNISKINKAVIPIVPVWGIVASQDCDATRVPYLIIFKIEPFKEVSGFTLPAEDKTKPWVDILTQKSRLNANWFYLPIHENLGISERMAVNYEITFQILRNFLEKNVKRLRKGRLNEVAYQHFREKTSEYFRRYPYDEWYPFNKTEFEFYKKKLEERGVIIKPFPWNI